MTINDSNTSVHKLSNLVWKHLEERDWHNSDSRSVATSIVLEASELLEHYQWSDKPVGSKIDLAEELADIINYCLNFAKINDIDITTAVINKLEKSAKKYPAEKFKHKSKDEMRKTWIETKTKYNKTGL